MASSSSNLDEDRVGVGGRSSMSTISTKITSILSTSYGDLEIRDALATLDSQGFENTAEARRDLKLNMQKEILDCNMEVVRDFGLVATQLRSVGTALENLQKTCAEMRKHISYARIETAPMLEEASTLSAQKDRAEAKQVILKAFTGRFLLSEDELRVLTSGAEPVTDEFFHVLVKAKRIRKDCQVLLGADNQRLGLEILDQSTKNLNAAFQKLFRWVQRELKMQATNLENAHLMNASMRRGIRVLAERPTLFQNCLDTFAETREKALRDAFYDALSKQSQEQQKPIEFSAHEPLRYVGDMLAWTHATTVSEREGLEGLFVADGEEIAKSIKEGLESEPWSRSDEPFDGKKALGQLVNASLAGVAQLLRQRIEQVMTSHDESVLSYKIANLCAFYQNIFTKLVYPHDAGGFIEALKTTQEAALEQFKSLIRYHVRNVRSEPFAIPEDGSPPLVLSSALEELVALLKSYDTSTFSSDVQSKAALNIVFEEALDPFLEIHTTLLQGKTQPTKSIFLINNLIATKSVLSRFAFTAEKVAELDALQTEQQISLLEFLTNYLVQISGIQPLLSAIDSTPSAKLPAHPTFSVDNLTQASATLDDFLASSLMDATEQLGRLRAPDLTRTIIADAAERFCVDFERLVDALDRADDILLTGDAGDKQEQQADADEEKEDETEKPLLRELYPRSIDEVRILLS